jgi:acyl-CoA synthetase (AMP-forming)/AMP-acid ligase II
MVSKPMSAQNALVTNNIAHFLPLMAQQSPTRVAVAVGAGRDPNGKTSYDTLSYAELNKLCDEYARGLSDYGFVQGQRVLLMVRPGLELLCLAFALFKIGCIPILIDPGMGRRNLAICIEECQPEAMVGIPLAQVARWIFWKSFRSIKRTVTVAKRWYGGGPTLESLRKAGSEPFPIAPTESDASAAIAFTTGSTGVPKGVIYTHGIFQAQIEILRDLYGVQPEEVDMPAFPLFALFNIALGTTSAIPDMDATKPASVDPRKIIEIIQDWNVSYSFGSPAIWNRVSRYCLDNQVKLPSLRRILMAGAPVPPYLHERFEQILAPEGNTYTPYGATEALPVTSISGREVLARKREPIAGTCVGKPITQVTMQIIPINDGPIERWDDSLVLPAGQVGEIVVKGPVVTQAYFNRPDSNRLAKIAEGDLLWHRMGDLGYFDQEGYLWFYGRKTHRVVTADTTFFTEPCELVFNQHPRVFRSALVGVKRNGITDAVMVIEPEAGAIPRDEQAKAAFIAELKALGAQFAMTQPLQTFLFHPSFPVDIRHNAKIFREKLAVWASDELKSR